MTTKYDAVEIASRRIEAAGFILSAMSNQSEARYYELPGRCGTLRVAAHTCRHPFGVVATCTFEYREAWQRDEGEIGLCDEEIAEWAEAAMEEYRENAEPIEENE